MTKSVVSISSSETLLHMKLTLYIFQSIAVCWDCSMKNFVKLTGKHFGQSLFLINLQAVPEPFSNLFLIIMMYVECVTEGFFFWRGVSGGEVGREVQIVSFLHTVMKILVRILFYLKTSRSMKISKYFTCDNN